MSVAILHCLLSFTHLLGTYFSALTLCKDIIQQFKSQQALCPCATCPVHTKHCTALDYCPTLPNCIISLITLSVCHMSSTHNTRTALDYCPTLPNCIISLITLSMCHMSCTHNTRTALDYCPTLPNCITSLIKLSVDYAVYVTCFDIWSLTGSNNCFYPLIETLK
jgi:hypothetical protein